ncbi:restriction endonuclease subunit S [Malikia spinosa]|uniref:restriction endonuclease subunit S n=1 Tax=Malikia spinosa TaxID=86180 RepID=UPI003FA1C595
MSSDEFLKSYLLGEIGEFKNGANFSQEDYGPGYPIVNVKQLYAGRYVTLENLESLGASVLKRPEQLFLEPGDILFARSSVKRSGAGQCALVPEGVANTIFSGFIIRYRLNDKYATNPMFLSYLLQSPVYREIFPRIATGTTISNLSQDALKGVEVKLPSKAAQDNVADVLGALDDRITLLRKTNATLEAIAQALFKSWFVDFDPVRAKMEGRTPEGMDEATAALFPDSFKETELGAVPRGWRVRPIGEMVDTLGGATPDTKNEAFWTPATHHWTSPKDMSGLATPVLLDTERRISAAGLAKISSGLLPVGSLLMSSRAPIGYLALTQVPVAINQGYIAMPPGGLLPPLYMLFWCRQYMDNIKGRANGSTFMEISKKAFRPIPAVEPSAAVVQAFVDVANALFLRLVENEKQAQTLATLRDTLLPRLISGQLRLPEPQYDLCQ